MKSHFYFVKYENPEVKILEILTMGNAAHLLTSVI